MEKVVHRADARGKGDYGWLTTRYSFSFANWYDPSRMGFGTLRVINDDQIAPHQGFDTHQHRDMEIITFVTEGELTHRDSMGNSGVVHAGEVQVMSAGTGVAHSEHNDGDIPLSLFQIWITPNKIGVTPSYAQKSFSSNNTETTLLVSPDGESDSLQIQQNAYISRVILDAEYSEPYILHKEGNGVYVFVIEGGVHIDGEVLESRDAIGIRDVQSVDIRTTSKAEVLFFEVPME